MEQDTYRAATSAWEREVRKRIASDGLEFRTDAALRNRLEVTGNNYTQPDLYFADLHLAVFLDGCYWHGCPDHHPTSPHRHRRARDQKADAELARRGYDVVRVWEHEGVDVAVTRILEQLGIVVGDQTDRTQCDESCHDAVADICPTKCDTLDWDLMCDTCRSYAAQDADAS